MTRHGLDGERRVGLEDLRVTIAHDSVTVLGGAERVLETLLSLCVGAPLYTAVYRPMFEVAGSSRRAVVTSPLQRLPLPVKLLKPLFPWAFERFRVPPGTQLVLSNSSGYAKGVRACPGAVHVSYVHTPLRRVWNAYHRAAGPAVAAPGGAAVERLVLAYLRRWDLGSMRRVDHVVANSRNTANQVARIYGREASIVHPPVRTSFFTPGRDGADDYFLVASRLDPYKRVDLAIHAARRLRARLIVVGGGVERPRLERLAGGSVTFAGVVDDEHLRGLYRRCRAVVFPGEEDFGIVPVEAQACGRPVVAFAAGGALETIIDGETGLLFEEQSAEALAAAMARVETMRFDADRIRAHALQFDETVWRARIESLALRAVGTPV